MFVILSLSRGEGGIYPPPPGPGQNIYPPPRNQVRTSTPSPPGTRSEHLPLPPWDQVRTSTPPRDQVRTSTPPGTRSEHLPPGSIGRRAVCILLKCILVLVKILTACAVSMAQVDAILRHQSKAPTINLLKEYFFFLWEMYRFSWWIRTENGTTIPY